MLKSRLSWAAKPGHTLLIIQLVVLSWLGYLVVNQFLTGYTLQGEIGAQARENTRLGYRNQRLVSQVEALRSGDDSVIEERARKDLGMVKDEETFFIFVD